MKKQYTSITRSHLSPKLRMGYITISQSLGELRCVYVCFINAKSHKHYNEIDIMKDSKAVYKNTCGLHRLYVTTRYILYNLLVCNAYMHLQDMYCLSANTSTAHTRTETAIVYDRYMLHRNIITRYIYIYYCSITDPRFGIMAYQTMPGT